MASEHSCWAGVAPARGLRPLVLVAALTAMNLGSPMVGAADDLTAGFVDPPAVSKPRVWWQWMNGNVTREGVRADLEWMQRVGIGGVHNIDASLRTPQLVTPPAIFLTDEWRQMFNYSVTLANELGLDFDIESTPGWSMTGGPWVEPRQAMKKLVWSETRLAGGVRFAGVLPAPPKIAGLFQSIPAEDTLGKRNEKDAPFYADTAVLAFRTTASEAAGTPKAALSSSSAMDLALLQDGDLGKTTSLPFNGKQPAWIQFSYPQRQRIQAISAVVGDNTRGGVGPWEVRQPAWLAASDDGRSFRKIVDLPRRGAPQQTVSFAPVTARVFRLMLEQPRAEMPGIPAPATHKIAEVVLHAAARVNRFEDKAGYSTRAVGSGDDTPEVDPADAVPHVEVIDVTDRMRTDGRFDWTPPGGDWTVLRFGYSLIGAINRPASPASTGLEVDKLNSAHVKSYIENYLQQYERALGGDLVRKGLRNMHVGSFEAGPQNWTDDMLEQFKRRRGYDARPWLPTLTGRIVDSAAASDRFLWDFRQTIGDLLVDAHYETIAAVLRRRGIGSYFESHAERRASVADGMRIKKAADIPMGEMWVERIRCCDVYTEEVYDADVAETASVAHLYGKSLVAAESFTTSSVPYGPYPYSTSPEDLKPTADRMLAMGINRFMVHSSVHQPLDKPGPGITLGSYGQWLTRKETWAEQSGVWMDYLARSSYLQQQGRFVADIAYLYGEDVNVSALFRKSRPAIPEGYGYDFINAAALIEDVEVRDGLLVTASGMKYRVLALDPSTSRMTLRVLRRIKALVAAGAVVVGAKPVMTPSLADDAEEFRRLADEVWNGQHAQGAVIADSALANALQWLGVEPDLTHTKPREDTKILFSHRRTDDSDIYFINSRNSYPQSVEVSLRTVGRVPELWRADTGKVAPLSYRMEEGRTLVVLELDPNDAVFVVLKRPTTVASAVVPSPVAEKLADFSDSWDLAFPPHLGAPAAVRMSELGSWSASDDPGVRYFSGTATYSRQVQIPAQWLAGGARLRLDLGVVKNVAEVRVNGRFMGVAWKAPFTIDVTEALRAGENRIEIAVSNLWRNRLIGDKQPGMTPIAFATHDPFKAETPLLASGLLGPVTLVKVTPSRQLGTAE